jgi:hypothetical protein
MLRFRVPPAPLCSVYEHTSLLVANPENPTTMPGTEDPAPLTEVEHVINRIAAVKQHRQQFEAGTVAHGKPCAEPVAAALRGLVAELENLSRDQDVAIADLQQRVVRSAQQASETEHKIEALESDLRQSAENSTLAEDRIEKQECQLRLLQVELDDKRERARQAEITERKLQEQITRAHESLDDANQINRAALETKMNQAATITSLQEDLDKAHESLGIVKCTIDFQSSKIIDLENELQEARLCAKTSEQLAKSEQDKALGLESDLQRSYESASNINETVRSQRDSIVVLEAHVSEASALREANSVIIEEMSAKLLASEDALISKKEECLSLQLEVDNLQNTCTNYASVIAIASHHLSGAGQSVPACDEEVNEIVSAESPSKCLTGSMKQPLGALQLNTNLNCNRINSNSEDSSRHKNAANVRKFQFRVDVPPFQPSEANFGASSPGSSILVDSGDDTASPGSINGLDSAGKEDRLVGCALSYPRLFWCPPGTSASVIVTTAYSSDSENVKIIDIPSEYWVDEDLLWSRIWPVLKLFPGLSWDEAGYRAKDSLEGLQTALEDIASSAEGTLGPILFVMRDAGLLSPAKVNKKSERGSRAIDQILKFVDVLARGHSTLLSGGLSVAVVLEGWPSSIPIGRHSTRSLALPRVCRRLGKSKRTPQTGRQNSICLN